MCSTSGSCSSSGSWRFTRRGLRRSLLVASAAVLAAASLLGKALTYGAEPAAGSEPGDERHVENFLADRGWLRNGPTESIPGGSVLPFQAPDCSGTVLVGVLPPNGEVADLFALIAGPDTRIFYAYRGRISDAPARLAYFEAKIARVMQSLAFALRPDRPVVAVGQPPTCRLETALPWSAL